VVSVKERSVRLNALFHIQENAMKSRIHREQLEIPIDEYNFKYVITIEVHQDNDNNLEVLTTVYANEYQSKICSNSF
jgi:hypothetical protein